MGEVSKVDEVNLKKIRENVKKFISSCANQYDEAETLLLDIAPQVHEGAAPYFRKAKIETLDIDPESGAMYIADICEKNSSLIPKDKFDYIVCTEVLEHTLQPFDAINEIQRILKPGGLVFATIPFNLRIHGPLPDCWRFTEHGLRALFKNFIIVSLEELEDKTRFLMPIHYTLVARKPK